MCKPKKEDGLGVKDLRLVILALLSRWRWSVLMDMQFLWKTILSSRYGAHVRGSLPSSRVIGLRKTSFWWIGVSLIDSSPEQQSDWFYCSLSKVVGDSLNTGFWHNVWVG